MASDNAALLKEIGQSNENFSRNFLKVLEPFEGNLISSPLSAQLVLTLAHLGAKGKTAEDMSTDLCLPSDRETIKSGFKALMTTFQNNKDVILKIANRVYVKNVFEVVEEFMKDNVDTFNSSVARDEVTDLSTVKAINSWVEEVTNDKIKDMISPGINTISNSPKSAQLTLAHLVANGKTAEEMSTAHFTFCDWRDTIKSRYRKLMSSFEQFFKDFILNIVNPVSVKKAFEFMKDAVDTFNSSVEYVEFADPSTVKAINRGVEEVTNDKIKVFISPDNLDGLTRMLFINTIYYKGKWASPFKPERKFKIPSLTDQITSTEKPSTHQKTHYEYANLEDLQAPITELPYQGNQLNLVLVLPISRVGLAVMKILNLIYKIALVFKFIKKFKIKTK